MSQKGDKFVYITYLSNDRDYKGALLLNYNLKKYNHKYELECIILEGVSEKVKNILEKSKIRTHFFCLKNILTEFNVDDSYSECLISKHYYGKYLIFRLTQYDKIIYLDTDLLIKKNIDHLFDYDTTNSIYMTYDVGYYLNDLYFKQNKFNSGVIILKPSFDVFNNCYNALRENKNMICDNSSTDQEIFNLLNETHIINVEYLNFKYNYISVLGDNKDIVKEDVVIIHFILHPKPWNIIDFEENVIDKKIYFTSKIFLSEWLDLYFNMTKELLDNMTCRNVDFSYNKKYVVDKSICHEKTEISFI